MEKKNKTKTIKFSIIFSILILFVLLLISYTLKCSDKLYNKSSEIVSKGHVENIESNQIIEKEIVGQYNNLKEIDIKFEPFKDEIMVGGTAKISLFDEENNLIREQSITRNYIRENNIFRFKFNKQKNSLNKKYYLKIQFTDKKENYKFFSVCMDENNSIAESELYLNNQRLLFYIVVISLFTIYTIIISFLIFNDKIVKSENIFLATIPVICIFYILCMPTFKNHDELYHWYRSYEVSMGKFMTGIDGDTLGTEMPSSIRDISTKDWTSITYGTVRDTLNTKLDKDNKSLIYSETSAVYSGIQYIPQGIGIAIARIFTDKVLLLAYAGRIANMIVAVILLYFAIKNIPFGKNILLILTFIPILIEGISSLSPDALTITLCFFFASYIFKLAFNKKITQITGKQLIFIAVLSIIIALCKIVYIPIVLLIFILPKEKIQKKYAKLIPIFLVACMANLMWLNVSKIYLAHFREGDSVIQVKSILLNPIEYVQICLNTIDLNLESYISTCFGEKIGWGELIHINYIVPYTLFILTLFISLNDNTIKNKFNKFQTILISLICVSIVALIFTSLYVQWTYCQSTSIAGIQGRYLIPILPLTLILIGSKIKNKSEYSEQGFTKAISITGLILQIISISAIVVCHL